MSQGLLLAQLAPPVPLRTENLVLVTLDGLRWQEVFGPNRQALLPFLWGTVAARGQLYGNRALNAANRLRFSYPGYKEILTGYPDPRIRNNPHASVLERIGRRPAYQGRVAAFASWEVMRNILNEPCCDFPIKMGWQPVGGPDLTSREQQLNATLPTCGRPFGQEHTDTLTCAYAFEYLKRRQPRVLYLSLGNTDEQVHAGRYADYLQPAHTDDDCLTRRWAYLQAIPQYRNKTTLLITTDHGRGRDPWWRCHGLQVPGSGQTWLAGVGPDTPATGEQRGRGQLYQSQVAQTLALLLGEPYLTAQPTGAASRSVLATP